MNDAFVLPMWVSLTICLCYIACHISKKSRRSVMKYLNLLIFVWRNKVLSLYFTQNMIPTIKQPLFQCMDGSTTDIFLMVAAILKHFIHYLLHLARSIYMNIHISLTWNPLTSPDMPQSSVWRLLVKVIKFSPLHHS